MPNRICYILLSVSLALFVSACTENKSPPSHTKESSGHIVTDDGIEIFYTQKGSGKNVLVAPVGFYLEPYLLDDLSKSRKVIMYDPRNRGRSGAADLSTVSLDRQIQDLENLRVALGIEEMALLGWSGLGMEMAVYTMRHPNRVSRLIHVSPVPPAAVIFEEAGDARNDAIDAAAVEALDARAEAGEFDDAQDEYCRLSNDLTLPSNFVDTDLVSKVVDVCIYENEWPENLWPYFGALIGSFDGFDWRDDLEKLTMPRLVIHGREDGIPLVGGEAWVRGQEDARILVLSPSGHFPFIEQQEQTINAINTFLDGEWPSGAVTLEEE